MPAAYLDAPSVAFLRQLLTGTRRGPRTPVEARSVAVQKMTGSASLLPAGIALSSSKMNPHCELDGRPPAHQRGHRKLGSGKQSQAVAWSGVFRTKNSMMPLRTFQSRQIPCPMRVPLNPFETLLTQRKASGGRPSLPLRKYPALQASVSAGTCPAMIRSR